LRKLIAKLRVSNNKRDKQVTSSSIIESSITIRSFNSMKKSFLAVTTVLTLTASPSFAGQANVTGVVNQGSEINTAVVGKGNNTSIYNGQSITKVLTGTASGTGSQTTVFGVGNQNSKIDTAVIGEDNNTGVINIQEATTFLKGKAIGGSTTNLTGGLQQNGGSSTGVVGGRNNTAIQSIQNGSLNLGGFNR
jgi:hypothetical protein